MKKQKIKWKKFILYSMILLPVFLLFDIGTDALKGSIKWDEIWALKNMFFKVAAAIVGGYFASTFNDAKEEDAANKANEGNKVGEA